jgi:carbon-monoxide dehydrogenase medium subunit
MVRKFGRYRLTNRARGSDNQYPHDKFLPGFIRPIIASLLRLHSLYFGPISKTLQEKGWRGRAEGHIHFRRKSDFPPAKRSHVKEQGCRRQALLQEERLFCPRSEGIETPMRYEAPESLDAAVALLADAGGKARVLAGGTDLLVQMKGDVIAPDLVVDIKKIDEVRSIVTENGGFRIGAAVTGAELGEHAGVKAAWPGVVEAVELIGSTQVQGRATPGGNLCNGSPAADSVPAMIAAGATVDIVGPNGRRTVPVEDVPTGPGTTSLATGEIVVSFFLPAKPARSGDAYLRMIPRTEMDIAVVGAGVCLTLDEGGVCTAARVALGAVAPTALLVPEAAEALIGTTVDEAALEKLAAAASAACRPIDDKRGTKEYRIKVAGVMARRAAQTALERAGK